MKLNSVSFFFFQKNKNLIKLVLKGEKTQNLLNRISMTTTTISPHPCKSKHPKKALSAFTFGFGKKKKKSLFYFTLPSGHFFILQNPTSHSLFCNIFQ